MREPGSPREQPRGHPRARGPPTRTPFPAPNPGGAYQQALHVDGVAAATAHRLLRRVHEQAGQLPRRSLLTHADWPVAPRLAPPRALPPSPAPLGRRTPQHNTPGPRGWGGGRGEGGVVKHEPGPWPAQRRRLTRPVGGPDATPGRGTRAG